MDAPVVITVEPTCVAELMALEHMVMSFAWCELAQGVSYEGSYQYNGATMSRTTFFEAAVMGYWPDAMLDYLEEKAL